MEEWAEQKVWAGSATGSVTRHYVEIREADEGNWDFEDGKTRTRFIMGLRRFDLDAFVHEGHFRRQDLSTGVLALVKVGVLAYV